MRRSDWDDMEDFILKVIGGACVIICMVALAMLFSPAYANPYEKPEKQVFWQSGPWTVEQMGSICGLGRRAYHDGLFVEVGIAVYPDGMLNLFLQPVDEMRSIFQIGEEVEVGVVFDGEQWTAPMRWGGIAFQGLIGGEFVTDFMLSNRMDVWMYGEQRGSFSLKGSAKGVTALRLCHKSVTVTNSSWAPMKGDEL